MSNRYIYIFINYRLWVVFVLLACSFVKASLYRKEKYPRIILVAIMVFCSIICALTLFEKDEIIMPYLSLLFCVPLFISIIIIAIIRIKMKKSNEKLSQTLLIIDIILVVVFSIVFAFGIVISVFNSIILDFFRGP